MNASSRQTGLSIYEFSPFFHGLMFLRLLKQTVHVTKKHDIREAQNK
jgi:hypothetical protein